VKSQTHQSLDSSGDFLNHIPPLFGDLVLGLKVDIITCLKPVLLLDDLHLIHMDFASECILRIASHSKHG
jgi:hypothetical protein